MSEYSDILTLGDVKNWVEKFKIMTSAANKNLKAMLEMKTPENTERVQAIIGHSHR